MFPYQLMSACMAASDSVPAIVRDALQEALELSLLNVPQIAGRVVVCPDVSGSMSSPVTGYRGSATSSVRCIDVAALVAAAMLRKNPDAVVLPFEQSVVTCAARCARQRDEECGQAGGDRWRRHQLQRAAGCA